MPTQRSEAKRRARPEGVLRSASYAELAHRPPAETLLTRSWQIVDTAHTSDGELKLMRRGEGDFLITIDGRVLMNSHANRSEVAVAEAACRPIASRRSPRVLIGGLGVGCTLRAALEILPAEGRVTVVELHAVVAAWCAGPLAEVAGEALSDPRVDVVIDDVAEHIRRHTAELDASRFDAIVLDLFEGPHAATEPEDPIYGHRALARTARALTPDGLHPYHLVSIPLVHLVSWASPFDTISTEHHSLM